MRLSWRGGVKTLSHPRALGKADARLAGIETGKRRHLRQIAVHRYVTPLREGGSLPAVVEGDDLGLYVLKFRGAGQGARALVAEWIGGEVARALGLPMPEIVAATLDPILASTEGDPEIQDLIRASAGLNLALDYLPGAVTFDPAVDVVDGELASRIVWLDAFLSNVDRTARNANMLMWHRKLWLIDHGAALYFHHGWDGRDADPASRFPLIRDHVLLPYADRIEAVDADCAARLGDDVLRDIVMQLPNEWLGGEGLLADPDAHRQAYLDYLIRRVAQRQGFVQEAVNARA